MPFVPVPKDLSHVKNKIAFGLTKRQLICFTGAAFTGVPFYIFTRKMLGTDVSAMLMIVLMIPWFLFGMYEKDGQPLEKVLFRIIRVKFLAPKVRPYKTDNSYAALEKQAKLEKEAEALEPKRKERTAVSKAVRKPVPKG